MALKEHHLKQFILSDDMADILSKNDINVNKERDKVYYEKAIDYGNSIVDSLILDYNFTIGIEIKTENDSLKRLYKQLQSYIKVCTYVFVLVHDKHVEEAERILNREASTRSVGIISYDNFDGEIIAGLYRPAKLNTRFSLYDYINAIENKQGIQKLSQSIMGVGISSSYSKRMMVRQLVNLYGDAATLTKIVNQFEIDEYEDDYGDNHKYNMRKYLRFGDTYKEGWRNYSEEESYRKYKKMDLKRGRGCNNPTYNDILGIKR